MEPRMSDDFQEIKDRVDIVAEITRRTGKQVKQVGASMDLEQCPFCSGHACFRIRPETRSWSCHQCGGKTGGTIIDFVMKEKNCTRYEALEDLAKAINYPLENAGPSGAILYSLDAKSQIFEAAAKYYSMALLNTGKATSYQVDVRRHSIDTLKSMNVGFSDGGLLPELLKQGFSQEDILKSGLVVPDKKRGGNRDCFFPGLYIYPHKDIKGMVCDFTTKDPQKKYAMRLKKDDRKDGAPFMGMDAFKADDILIVEGENDLLSIRGRGKYPHVVATTGQLSQGQIEYLVKWAETGNTKTIILGFDNDDAGRRYTQRIKDAFTHRCYPDKLCEINEGLRIRQAKRVQDDEESVTGEIPQMMQVVLKILQFDQRYNDIDDCIKAMTDPEKEFKALMAESRRHLAPIAPLLNRARAWHKACGQKSCNNPIGEIVFDWFSSLGGFFVKGEDHKLFFKNKIYEIGNKSAFKALLYDVCELNYADNSTKSILEVVKARAHKYGKHTNGMGWIHTDLKKPAVYIDLHNESNTILKIQPGSVEVIQNGANDDQVLVMASPMMTGINYLPDVNIIEAMTEIKNLVFDNLACNDSNRFYILARAMCYPLTEFVNARGITKFSGNQGSGKSLAARLLSYLVVGADCLSQGSVASYRSEATQSPFIFPDNLEQANLTNDMTSLLIMSATGAINQKRDSNTSSGNIYEENKTHIITTSIEPFVKSELASRTIDIHFKPEYRNENFPGETLLKTQIERSRDKILSAVIKIVACDVLPTYEQDQAEVYRLLNAQKKGHSKERLNEILGCLYLLCKQIVKYIPHNEYANKGIASTVLEDWIIEQDELTRENQQDADPILYRMEALLAECSQLNKEEFVHAYGIRDTQIVMDIGGAVLEVQFVVSAKELCTAFSVLSKNKNIPNPFTSPGVLGSRLSNSIGVLNNAGWEVMVREKKVQGQHKHFLRKKVNAWEG